MTNVLFRLKNEKIQFLKGIVSGSRRVDEITCNAGVSHWYEMEPGLFKGEGLELTREQLKEYQQRYPRKHYLLFVRAEGNAPLQVNL